MFPFFVAKAASRLTLRLSAAGSRMTSLLPQHVRHWWPIVEDIFYSTAVTKILDNCVAEAVRQNEFEFISVDATIKCCLSILGQAHCRATRAEQERAAFKGKDCFRKAAWQTHETDCEFLIPFLMFSCICA